MVGGCTLLLLLAPETSAFVTKRVPVSLPFFFKSIGRVTPLFPISTKALTDVSNRPISTCFPDFSWSYTASSIGKLKSPPQRRLNSSVVSSHTGFKSFLIKSERYTLSLWHDHGVRQSVSMKHREGYARNQAPQTSSTKFKILYRHSCLPSLSASR